MSPFRIYPIHDFALTVEFPLPIGKEAHEQVMRLQRWLQQFPLTGLQETVPAYNSLSVYLNDQTNWMEAKKELEDIFSKKMLSKSNTSKTIEPAVAETITIPVCYDSKFGLDQSIVCDTLGLTPNDLIRLHSQKIYTVYMTGFVPGFPYLGELDEQLVMPRKSTPTKKVPAGSVALAGKQTGIYPFEVPGGWQIIGKTPLSLFDKKKDPCCLLKAGMKVKFEPIDLVTFENWQ